MEFSPRGALNWAAAESQQQRLAETKRQRPAPQHERNSQHYSVQWETATSELLSKAKVFSSIDMASSFFHVPYGNEESADATSLLV